jgi:acyl-[acyl carrier protein]--UDP-N-acetylglucosamine O-acyltransferase
MIMEGKSIKEVKNRENQTTSVTGNNCKLREKYMNKRAANVCRKET